jgi:hypothetical protein
VPAVKIVRLATCSDMGRFLPAVSAEKNENIFRQISCRKSGKYIP